MKTKRSKANRRTMTVYNSVFKFREPYQVLFDADFSITVTTQKMEVQKRLAAVLVFDLTFGDLASDGSQVAQEAVDLTRNICERRKCNHWKTKASSVECIKGILGDTENRLRYIVCTQDLTFRKYLRENILQEDKLHVPSEELEKLQSATTGLNSSLPVQLIQRPSTSDSHAKQSETVTSNSETASAHKLENKLMKKKKRRTGGPNPLSVKKKKSSATNKRRLPKAKATSTTAAAPKNRKALAKSS
ncbi:hypothetical protein PCANC_22773 [Puccinia coronata f. sp. avenae]|uniref:UTP23 sensor motif region domain-containing protein n=1 Tax=Puccinia coronata f. sp. avenae TaxID=200324 RepID=A0A2N5S9W7_9BASI|nr:hypothetical protein PCANC_22773 [Puccinia coronata f. sp. avenae]